MVRFIWLQRLPQHIGISWMEQLRALVDVLEGTKSPLPEDPDGRMLCDYENHTLSLRCLRKVPDKVLAPGKR
jgi:hypothetical protein